MTKVIDTPDVTHVRYNVGARTTLRLDDRDRSGEKVG